MSNQCYILIFAPINRLCSYSTKGRASLVIEAEAEEEGARGGRQRL